MRQFEFSISCNGIVLGSIVGDGDCIQHTLEICGLRGSRKIVFDNMKVSKGHIIANFPIDYDKMILAARANECGLLSYGVSEYKPKQSLSLAGISIGRQMSFHSVGEYDCTVIGIFPDGNDYTTHEKPYYVRLDDGGLTYYAFQDFLMYRK